MNKNRLLIFLIAGLLISNILLVVFMMKGRGPGHHGPPHHKGGSPRDLIIERLHLDAGQIKKYDTLIKKHRSDLSGYEETLLALKTDLYSNLKNKTDKATIYYSIDAIAKVQAQIESVHYTHFEDIKNLCKPEQLKDFDKLVNELARIFSHGPPPPPHHKPH
jgi:periplasmic protein CpxP/Spy